ncbi:MAG: hypothetical protein HRU00_07015 [Myxococcales bacterium]|nr:hypothetical protein [Myxococcales bacterium]
MAKILGNLVPEDDFTHPLGPEENFNESMYFNFFDRERGLGGFLRLGNRANEGHAEMTVTLYLPDGRVLFMFKRPQISHNDAFDAGGCRFEVLEPSQRLRTSYAGSVVELEDARSLSDPSRAFRESPRKKVRVDLVHDAVGPMYGGARSQEHSELPPKEQFASAHYEQHMQVSGTVAIDDESLTIEGFGLRDHSWGPRYWQAIESYEWLTMNFGPDFHAMVSIVRRDAENVRAGGVIVRGDEIEKLVSAEITADYESNGLYHRKLRAKIETEKGERLEIDGIVRGFIPLRNRRGGQTTHIGEGMTEWRCGDSVGYGLSEFLKQIP